MQSDILGARFVVVYFSCGHFLRLTTAVCRFASHKDEFVYTCGHDRIYRTQHGLFVYHHAHPLSPPLLSAPSSTLCPYTGRLTEMAPPTNMLLLPVVCKKMVPKKCIKWYHPPLIYLIGLITLIYYIFATGINKSRAGVRGAGVIRTMFSKSIFFQNFINCIPNMSHLPKMMTNILIKNGNIGLFIFRAIWNRR